MTTQQAKKTILLILLILLILHRSEREGKVTSAEETYEQRGRGGAVRFSPLLLPPVQQTTSRISHRVK